MALAGRFTLLIPEESKTEFTTSTVTYPSELPSDHPDYEKRGTSEDVQIPVVNKSSSLIENVYVNIRSIEMYRSTNEDEHTYNITYRQYDSIEDRTNDPEGYTLETLALGIKLDHTKPLMVQAYEFLNSQEGWEELTTV